ncbi:MAG: HIT family protein [Bacteroidota bacterium]
MPTLFTEIIEKNLPAYIIAEDAEHIAFLDIAPVAKGHTLVVPKKEVDYLFDLSDHVLGKLLTFTKKIALALEHAVPCQRIGMAVLGLEIPHAHIHLVPIQQEKDLNLQVPRLTPSHTDLSELAHQVKNLIKP